jgi:hypothetical protein
MTAWTNAPVTTTNNYKHAEKSRFFVTPKKVAENFYQKI